MKFLLFSDRLLFQLSVVITLVFPLSTLAAITLTDDAGIQHRFNAPVQRIISLSPHATELLFAAGASQQIVGVVNYSDYPEVAKKIPRIGGYNKFDLEKIISLQPDVIISWPAGNPASQLDELKKLGFTVYASEPKAYTDVAKNLINMGKLLGTEKLASEIATNFLDELETLKKKYQNRTIVNVFYQVWNEPLMTISDGHLITQIIEFCGGHNVFSGLAVLAPRISIEAVIEKNPDVIIVGMTEERQDWLDLWKNWPGLDAVKNNQVYPVDAELVIRQSPRVLKGTQLICETLDKVRKQR